MGISFRIMPGVRLSASSRGIRAGVGPRIARVHVGAGRTGVSTGLGPFGAYTSVGAGRRRSARGPSVSEQERAMRRSERHERVVAAHELDKVFLRDFLMAHTQTFDQAVRPAAPAPQPVDRAGLRRQQRALALLGISVLKRSDRKSAKARADQEAERLAATETQRREAAAAEQQEELDHFWERLVANDEETVLACVEAAFEDNEAPAAAVGCDDGSLSLVMRFPPVDGVVPETHATVTAAGNPTVKKRTKTDRNDLYVTALASHALVTVKEAFAVATALREARLLAIIENNRVLTPVLYARYERAELADVDWQRYPEEITADVARDGIVGVKGRTGEPDALSLRDRPELLGAVKQIANDLGALVDPACLK